MNILVLIRELDKTPLQRQVRNGLAHGEVITFYNETGDEYTLVIDSVEYEKVVQACVILKEHSQHLYIQHGENPNLVKLNIDNIEELSLYSSILN